MIKNNWKYWRNWMLIHTKKVVFFKMTSFCLGWVQRILTICKMTTKINEQATTTKATNNCSFPSFPKILIHCKTVSLTPFKIPITLHSKLIDLIGYSIIYFPIYIKYITCHFYSCCFTISNSMFSIAVPSPIQ